MADHRVTQDVHRGAYFSATDPALDADNMVQAGKMWIDTSDGEDSAVLKFRNTANTAWITLSLGGTPANAVTMGGEAVTMGGETVTMGA